MTSLPTMYALVADLHALIARLEGMKAANQQRVLEDFALAYCEQDFIEIQLAMENIAAWLRKEI